MRRRDFLRTAAAAGAFAAVGGALPAFPFSGPLRLVVMHTSDTHSHIDPVRSGGLKGMGGVAAREALIRRIRAENAHTLLLDSGDIFQGTPWFNLYRGEPEMRVMSALGYDASAIGNHDFDAGVERLAEVVRDHARFPMLCCNYGFEGTAMEGHFRECAVREFDGMRVGLLGLGIDLDGLVGVGQRGGTQFLDPVGNARRVARRLRHDEGCDFIIALSHVSINGRRNSEGTMRPGDRDVARAVPEIDVILGGHDHIILDQPELVPREGAEPCVVMHHGWAGAHLGVLSFDIFSRGRSLVRSSAVRAVVGTA